MTPKEKAIELFEMFIAHTRVFHEGIGWVNYEDSTKTCALICVDEIILALNNTWAMNAYNYWEQVKEEIEKL